MKFLWCYMNQMTKPKRNKTWEQPKQVVPYDTGKVKIGLLYTPPAPKMTRDDEVIQAALLGIKLTPHIPWQWLGGVVFVVSLLLTSVRWFV